MVRENMLWDGCSTENPPSFSSLVGLELAYFEDRYDRGPWMDGDKSRTNWHKAGRLALQPKSPAGRLQCNNSDRYLARKVTFGGRNMELFHMECKDTRARFERCYGR